jgi:predicted secreted protein
VTLAFAIALYFIIWWIVLFAMLPIGVRTSEEVGEKTSPGHAESAPHLPNLLPKMVATTVVASILFAALYAVIVHRVITLDDIPFFPRYEHVQERAQSFGKSPQIARKSTQKTHKKKQGRTALPQ